MIIKKYVGKTESEATEEAKKELGQNIVVMNVRPVKKNGFFSIFQSQKIEVTVALEEETEKTPIARTYTPDKNTRPVPRNPLVDVSQSDVLREPIKINKSPDIIDDQLIILMIIGFHFAYSHHTIIHQILFYQTAKIRVTSPYIF